MSPTPFTALSRRLAVSMRLVGLLAVVLSLSACFTGGGSLAPVPTAPPSARRSIAGWSAGLPPAPDTAACERNFGLACYTPAQLRRAYDLLPLYARGLDGTGTTIAIVVWFGSPTIRQDLARFDSAFGIPGPPSLQIIQPEGPVPRFNPRSGHVVGWARETTLDVEWAHAVAPGASILLVESVGTDARASGLQHIAACQRYVIEHGLADVISESWGQSEVEVSRLQGRPVDLALREAQAKHVTVVFSSGDYGAAGDQLGPGYFYSQRVVSWPASDPLVTSVGGLRMRLDGRGRRVLPDEVWNDTFARDPPYPQASGGGLSVHYRRPAYQDSVRRVVGDSRGIPDISMVAAAEGSAVVYESLPDQPGGFHVGWGTSLAAPMFAGIVAIADQAAGRPLGLVNPMLYRIEARGAPGLIDVKRGDNTVKFRQYGEMNTVRGWPAGPGYDLASGLGTIDAAQLVPELARLAHRS